MSCHYFCMWLAVLIVKAGIHMETRQFSSNGHVSKKSVPETPDLSVIRQSNCKFTLSRVFTVQNHNAK